MNIVYWWPEYGFDIMTLSQFFIYMPKIRKLFIQLSRRECKGSFYNKTSQFFDSFWMTCLKTTSDLSSSTVLNDRSVNRAINSGFSFVDSIQSETTSLAKWFFCVTPVPVFLITLLLGAWRGFTIQTVPYYQTGWVRERYHFFYREGVKTRVKWGVETENYKWQCRLYSFWSKSDLESLCGRRRTYRSWKILALGAVPFLWAVWTRNTSCPASASLFSLLDFVGMWVWETAAQFCAP